MSNIETFNTIVGLVFADLYEAFPIPILLRPQDYARKAGLCSASGSPCTDKEWEPASATIRWLILENYIHSPEKVLDGRDVQHCVLTLNGLRVLSTPQSLEKQESFGAGLARVAKSGVEGGIKSSIGELAKAAICEGGKVLFQMAVQGAIQSMVCFRQACMNFNFGAARLDKSGWRIHGAAAAGGAG